MRRHFLLLSVAAALGGCGSTATTRTVTVQVKTTTVTTAATTTASRTIRAAAKPFARKKPISHKVACVGVTINAVTSCQFAQTVKADYLSLPDNTIGARSAATGLTYSMNCSGSRGIVTCIGGNGAQLSFNGPAPPAEPTTRTPSTPPDGVYPNCVYGKETRNGVYDGQCLPNQNPNNVPLQTPQYVPPCYAVSPGYSGPCTR